MIDLGAKVDQADYFGRTPLHLAAANDYEEMVTFLISKGATVDLRIVHDEKRCTTVTSQTKPLNQVILFTKKHKDDNFFLFQTALHIAAGSDARAACEVLIENGANIEVKILNL